MYHSDNTPMARVGEARSDEDALATKYGDVLDAAGFDLLRTTYSDHLTDLFVPAYLIVKKGDEGGVGGDKTLHQVAEWILENIPGVELPHLD
jgi:hypothetical protein